MTVDKVPGRVFLDSSTLQTLQDYGEFIYDGGEITPDARIWSVPQGVQNVDALRQIMMIGSRGSLEFALSRNSLQEVLERQDHAYLQWALEMLEYWNGCLEGYDESTNAFSGHGRRLSGKLTSKDFGYLSTKDSALICDAVQLECDVFLTMERRLPKNGKHIERELGIRVLQPIEYSELLRPWAALLY